MNKKTLLSVLLALVLCFTTVVPAAAVPVFAGADTAVTAEETSTAATTGPKFEVSGHENALPSKASQGGVVKGDSIYIMEYDEKLGGYDSWTYELSIPRACMLNFYIASEEDEYTYADFRLTVTNKDTGDVVYDEYEWLNVEYYFDDEIGLDAGKYIIEFCNEDYSSNHFYLDVYYESLHTADDPYYHIYGEYAYVYAGRTTQLTARVEPAPATYETVIWSSSNPAVATVDQNGLVTGISAGEVTISANMDGHIAEYHLYVEAPVYKISATSATLYAKQTKQLKVTVDPEEFGLSGLTWKSSNTAVATVNSKGLVTAKAKGTATITATVNGVSKTCKITVKPMAISKTKATVYVKKTQQLTINGGTGKTTWKSGNKKVATVTSKGVVKGVKPGTATITAKKNGKTFKCKVTVKWEPETGTTATTNYSVSYSKDADFTMRGPGKISLTIKNTDSGDYADNLDVTVYNPNWKRVIDVSVAPGKTKTVTVNTTIKGEYSLSCYGYGKVTMKKTTKPVLSNSTMNVGKGYTGSLKVYGVKNGGKWSSSNKKIATVTSKGVVKGKKKGTCYIKYTLKTGKVIKCKVTVVNPVTCKVTSVYDTSIYNECWVKFTNNTNKKVTYIKLNITQYDNKGHKVKKNSYDYSWFYVNDTLKAKSSDSWEFKVNDDAKKCKAYITKVYFSDGSTWTP